MTADEWSSFNSYVISSMLCTQFQAHIGTQEFGCALAHTRTHTDHIVDTICFSHILVTNKINKKRRNKNWWKNWPLLTVRWFRWKFSMSEWIAMNTATWLMVRYFKTKFTLSTRTRQKELDFCHDFIQNVADRCQALSLSHTVILG